MTRTNLQSWSVIANTNKGPYVRRIHYYDTRRAKKSYTSELFRAPALKSLCHNRESQYCLTNEGKKQN